MSSILSLNVGSSSIKFALFEQAGKALGNRLAHGAITGLRLDTATLTLQGDAEKTTHAIPLPTHFEDRVARSVAAALEALLPFLSTHPLIAIGHRVVHGGLHYQTATPVVSQVLDDLHQLEALAPLHEPYNLIGINILSKLKPNIPQVACFDTAFHAAQPRLHRLFGLPKAMSDEGLIRYGFHGLSYDSIRRNIPKHLGTLPDKVLMAHLGSGASVCAMKDGVGFGSSLGFSTLDGLIMSTRAGAMDAGLILHLLQARGMTLAALQNLLYHESGLLGVSGVSAEMHHLIDLVEGKTPASEETKQNAQTAIDLFCHRASIELAAWLPAMQGASAMIFCGGIGENAPLIRAKIVQSFAWMGVKLAPTQNHATRGTAQRISTDDSSIPVWVIPTDEEWVIAESTHETLFDH